MFQEVEDKQELKEGSTTNRYSLSEFSEGKSGMQEEIVGTFKKLTICKTIMSNLGS